MFYKKIIVKKHKNSVYIQLPSLYDISNEDIQMKIEKLASIFSESFYVRVISKNENIVEDLQDFIRVKYGTVVKLKTQIKIVFNISKHELINLIKKVDFEETSIELINCIVNDNNQVFNLKDIECNFIFYLCDNDGPTIIFNENIYNFNKTLALINNIIN